MESIENENLSTKVDEEEYGCNCNKDEYGVAYSDDEKRLLHWWHYSRNEVYTDDFYDDYFQFYSIKDNTISICDEAFWNCTFLRFLEMPNSILLIGNKAFYRCYNLKHIVVSNSLISIGKEAFYRCDALQEINIPDSVVEIANDAFNCCKSLQRIIVPCNSIVKFKKMLPEELWDKLCESTEVAGFDNKELDKEKTLKKAQSFDYKNAEIVCDIKLNELDEEKLKCKQDKYGDNFLVLTPDVSGLENVTYAYCTDGSGRKPQYSEDNLIIFQKGDVFAAMFGNKREIDEDYRNGFKDKFGVIYSKDGCRLLKCENESIGEYIIKEGTETICDEAFENCSFLQQIILPNTVTYVGESVFKGCKSLKQITMPIIDYTWPISDECCTETLIPDIYISLSAFDGCETLQQIIIPECSAKAYKEILPDDLCNKLCYIKEKE